MSTVIWPQQYKCGYIRLSVPGKEEDVSGGNCVEILYWDWVFLELTSPEGREGETSEASNGTV